MIVPASLIPEFDTEMKSTRRVIERVPAEKGEWRPHPKSFPLGHLAQLLAWMPGWITNAVRESAPAAVAAPVSAAERIALLARHAGSDAEAIEAVRKALEEMLT